MKKLLVLVFCISIVRIGAGYADPFYPEAGRTIMLVDGGCGIGVHRGSYSGCTRVYPGYYSEYYRGFHRGYHRGYWTGYRDGYVDASIPSLMVDQGACSGRAQYRVCNAYGICWAACD